MRLILEEVDPAGKAPEEIAVADEAAVEALAEEDLKEERGAGLGVKLLVWMNFRTSPFVKRPLGPVPKLKRLLICRLYA